MQRFASALIGLAWIGCFNTRERRSLLDLRADLQNQTHLTFSKLIAAFIALLLLFISRQ